MPVVIKEVREISIFFNEDGGISIQQSGWPDDDQIVHFDICHIDTIIRALESAKEYALSSPPDSE